MKTRQHKHNKKEKEQKKIQRKASILHQIVTRIQLSFWILAWKHQFSANVLFCSLILHIYWCRVKNDRNSSICLVLIFAISHLPLFACEMCFCFSQTNSVMNDEISFLRSVNWSAEYARVSPSPWSRFMFFDWFLLGFCRVREHTFHWYWHGVNATINRRIDTCLHRIRPVISISMPSLCS